MRHCEDAGLAFLAWSPLDAGAAPLLAVERIAEARRASAQQIALAYLLTLSPAVIPLVGATRQVTARDSVGAMHLELSPLDISAIATELSPG